MAPAIKIQKEFPNPGPLKQRSGKSPRTLAKEIERSIGVTTQTESGLVVPREALIETEAVRAKDGKGVLMAAAEIATGTKQRGERQTRKARWTVLTAACGTLPAPAIVRDEHGNLIRNDGEGSKDYGTMELMGAIRLLMGAGMLL